MVRGENVEGKIFGGHQMLTKYYAYVISFNFCNKPAKQKLFYAFLWINKLREARLLAWLITVRARFKSQFFKLQNSCS